MTDRERAAKWLGELAMESCPVCGLEHDRRNPKCPPGYVGELAAEFAAVRAEARREALLEAADKCETEAIRIGFHWRGSIVDSAVHLARAIRSLLSTEPRDTQGDGGRR